VKQNIRFRSKVDSLNKELIKNKFNTDDLVFGSNIVLESYGLKVCKQIDYITSEKPIYKLEKMGLVKNELINSIDNKIESIYNPLFYFTYKELKFISFEQIFYMKSNSNEETDKKDIIRMKVLFSQTGFNQKIANFYYNYQTIKKYRIEDPIFLLFKSHKIYDFLRIFYKKFSKK
jgi:hypothetical protein